MSGNGNGHKGPRRLEVERRAASTQGLLETTLSATLERRQVDLLNDGYKPEYLACLGRAALMVRAWEEYDKRAELGQAEQAFIEVVSDNRRLRNALLQSGNRIARLPIDQGLRASMINAIAATLRAFKEPGEGRVLLAIEIGTKDTIEGVLAKCEAAVRASFANRKDQTDAPQADPARATSDAPAPAASDAGDGCVDAADAPDRSTD